MARYRFPTLLLVTLACALGPSLAACSAPDEAVGAEGGEELGIDGPFEFGEELGKADSAGVPGPAVATNTSDTQVWIARNKWEDTTTVAAKKAGLAWGADSGLTWDQKYAAWLDSMQRTPGSYYDTFTLTTPWGKTMPAPRLECAEVALFLRATFAAWYELPFYLTAVDAKGVRVYFGHFGARTKSLRYKNTPLFASAYKDYSALTAAELASQGWPHDDKLRQKGLAGGNGDDQMDFVAPGAHAGAYFDEIHLNKRVGHLLVLLLDYFGSASLADARNTFNLRPQAVRQGDVLVERWQKNGIGHTLVVKHVEPLGEGSLEAELVSGSMPRRQPKWEDGVASKTYFTSEETGGEGTNFEGHEYVKLGGGLKRFRVTKNVGGFWTNTWMKADEASWISDTDYANLKVRPTQFETLLGEVAPQQKRDSLVHMIEDAREHLRQYPGSCSARTKREDAFHELYALNTQKFGLSTAETDAEYRALEDYVFGELEYTKSKTCCWNSTTAAMYQIAMDYNESLMGSGCQSPVVFKAAGGGYDAFKAYAEQTGRGALWKAWSADETCPQANVVEDTEAASEAEPWCSIDDGGSTGGGCADDGFEPNDAAASAKPLGAGSHAGLAVCSGDDDWFSFTVPGGVDLRIDFDHAEGDLDIALTKNGSAIATSQGTSDFESVSATGGGTYTLRVYGYSGAANAYTLTATFH
ncbi:MAG: PPC domain-containing protein [Polyangiaceae bacterium]|nr:PPC domain-containing protein [Polyangiaceae bacterium]